MSVRNYNRFARVEEMMTCNCTLFKLGASVVTKHGHNNKWAMHKVCITAACNTPSHTVYSFLLTQRGEQEYYKNNSLLSLYIFSHATDTISILYK